MSTGSSRMRKPLVDDEKDDEVKPTSSKPKKNNNSDVNDKEKKPGVVDDLYHRFVDTFERSLNAVVRGETRAEPEPLSSQTLEGFAEYIKKVKPTNCIVLSGAGVSTAAGIPDFRTPGTGLYDNLAEYGLDDPQDIFDIEFFEKNPAPFYKLAKSLFPKDIKPTVAHYFIRLLEKKGILRRWFTQNIDSLEMLAGLDPESVVSAHGSHRTSRCLKCGKTFDLEWISHILNDPDQLVAYCDDDKCKGLVKPDITFFGESMPKRFFQYVVKDFPRCDLLIIMGTSLKVQPFAGLVDEVAGDCPRLLINMEPAGHFGHGDRMAVMEMCYGDKKNKRDVFYRGTTDDGCRRLAELLGWDEELDILVEQGPPTKKLQ